jgi:hypothetical protein
MTIGITDVACFAAATPVPAVADERELRAALGAIKLAENIDHAREIASAALADRVPG